jgi:hypothetical protein
MSDVKISALPSAGSLTGSEVVPIVQGGATKQVALSSITGLIDLSPYFKKDGTVAMTGHANWGGKNITNFGTLYSGNTNVIQNSTNANNYLQVASVGVVLNSNGEVTVQATALNVTTGSYKMGLKSDNLASTNRTAQFQDKDYTGIADITDITASNVGNTTAQWNANKLLGNSIPSNAIGVLTNDGSGNLTWSAAGGGTTTNALSVDNSSLQLNSGTTFDGSAAKTISVKALGITNAMLAGSIVDGKLASSYLYADGTRALTGAWYNTQNASFAMLGVGTGSTAPSAILHTVETGTSSPRGVIHDQYNTGTNSSQLNFRKARGTFASPTVITTGDILSNFNTWAYDGSGFINSAAIRVTSVGTIGTGRTPSKMEFMTMTDVTTGVLTTALTLDQSQSATFAAGVSSVSHAITGTGGTGNISLTAQSSAPTLSAGDTKMYIYADSSTRFSLAKRNAADSATITRTFVFNDASVTYTFPSSNTDTLAGLGTAQSWTAQQTFTGSAVQMPSLQLLDTTYKTAVDVSSANTVRIGNGFSTVTIAPGGTQVVSMSATVLTISKVTNVTGGLTNTGGAFSSTFNNTSSAAANTVIAELTGTYQLAASGVGSYTALLIDPTVNLTSASNTPVTLININPTLTSLTASNTIYGVRSQIASGTGTRWNIYADGTAGNYFGGDVTIQDKNLIFGTTTGTKLGTSTSQKIGFWNTTPAIQPTTSITGASITANSGTTVNDASTFAGYTIGQVVAALRTIGILA